MQYTNEELDAILEKHRKWLYSEEGGERADLSGANLYEADLRGSNLRGADLRGANLYEADLRGANLRGADLRGADLYEANLSGADLSGADLSGADLSGADLSGADLYEANLSGADLRGANLRGADLDPQETLRKGKILTSPMKGWKKCRDGKIVGLVIPKGAIVFSINDKCRTNKAKVVSIDGDKTKGLKAVSEQDSSFVYEVGKTVEVIDFNCQYNVECGTGIHFFKTEKEARDY